MSVKRRNFDVRVAVVAGTEFAPSSQNGEVVWNQRVCSPGLVSAVAATIGGTIGGSYLQVKLVDCLASLWPSYWADCG